jgi:8-oxo-dGTP pyrophosphatase MutT (NUDIX family)
MLRLMSSKIARSVGIQYAALPYRIEAGQVRILLITSRGTRRWVIPKGWPMNGLKPNEAAAVEATEEAGVIGEIEAAPIGSYRYMKALKDAQEIAVQVIVFPLRVEGLEEDWKERGQRRSEWFRYQRAATLVAEPALSHLIQDFGAARTPGLLAQSWRAYRSWRAGTRG